MDIQIQTEGGASVALLTGEINSRTAPTAQAQLVSLLEEKDLVLSMGGVSFMSSAGLRMLLLLQRQAAAKSRQITLVGLSEEIKDVMSITGFLHFFALADSLERLAL